MTLKEILTFWFHKNASTELNSLNNHFYAKCLCGNHGILTAGDLLDHLANEPAEHHLTNNCTCSVCMHERSLGCLVPKICRDITQKILDTVHQKWNPTHTPYIHA